MKRVALASAIVAASCGGEPVGPTQFVVWVDTDLPVPSALVTPAGPSFDRLRVDVTVSGKPVPGARDFRVTREQFERRTVSFGVVASPAAEVLARIRLFGSDRMTDDEPRESVTLDTTVRLSGASAGGRPVHVVLRAVDVGKAIGAPGGIEPNPGAPPSSLVGTWHGASRRSCSAAPRDGEACVPGGAFLMGSQEAVSGELASVVFAEERLVSVSPFFVDLEEVTVRRFREVWERDLKGRGLPAPLVGAEPPLECAWTPAPDVREDLALNCVAWTAANAYCRSLGKRLPSEAEWEWLASGLGDELPFPWGTDVPPCGAAVWGRQPVRSGFAAPCPAESLPRGPGTASRDRVAIDGRVVVDLAGNLAEWTRDVFRAPNEAPWAPPRTLVDPSVEEPGARHAVRGGAYFDDVSALRSTMRRPAPSSSIGAFGVGFRCVRPAA